MMETLRDRENWMLLMMARYEFLGSVELWLDVTRMYLISRHGRWDGAKELTVSANFYRLLEAEANDWPSDPFPPLVRLYPNPDSIKVFGVPVLAWAEELAA